MKKGVRGALAGGLACLALLVLAPGVAAATLTWDGGCGAETAWSCAANWSGDTVPGAADTAIFKGTATGDATVDAGFAGSVAAVKLKAGYTGTVSLERDLTVANGFYQSQGVFTAGSQALTMRKLTLSGGSFTASSGTTSVKGNLAISGSPTFDANGGTVEFTGLNATLACDGVTFNLVAFTGTGGTKTVGSDCSLPLGANPSVTGGVSIALNGTLSGSGTLTTARTLTLGATSALSGFAGLEANTLTVEGSYDFGAYSPFAVNGTFAVGPAAGFTAPAGTASFARDFTIDSGATFEANGGTLEFDGDAPFALACGNKTFNLVTFTGKGHETVNGDCTLPLGEDPDLGDGGMRLKGALSGSGTLSQHGTLEVESGAPGLDSFTDIVNAGSLVLREGAVLTAPSGELIVNGNFKIEEGAAFEANGGTVNFQAVPGATKTITCNEATFNEVVFTNTYKEVVSSDCTLPLGAEPTIGASGGEIALKGTFTGTGTLTSVGPLTLRETGVFSGFSAVAVEGSLSGTGTLSVGPPLILGTTGEVTGFSGLEASDLTVDGAYDFGSYAPFAVGGAFTLSSGAEFTAPEGTAAFAGDFANAGGTFAANGGTVALTGTGQQISGSTTFDNLTKTVGSTDTLTFEAGEAQIVQGALTLEGAEAGALLNLVSSSPGTPWQIEANGSREVEWVRVTDSENLSATIVAVESEDGGGNTGWEFP